MASDRRWGQIVQDLMMVAATPFIAYFAMRAILQRLDPDRSAKAEAQQKALAATTRLQSIFNSSPKHQALDSSDSDSDSEPPSRPPQESLTLTPYEQTIAMEVVSPPDIPVTFSDIGGLDAIIEDLRESIIYPLTLPHLYTSHSSLLSAPSGVLLYGPPGCGKTMLAKALARESGACFINLHISTLTEKWYGDSNKLVSAVFSLARKLQPTIVFIDEIDAVLGQRRSGEHEASGMVKAEFMTHWDGLASSTTEGGSQRICILGATNRIQDIDEAILRRLPKKFPIGLPNARQRRQIFELTLQGTRIDEMAGGFELEALVRGSAGMSGSDVKEVCRDAAMVPVRERIRELKGRGGDLRGVRAESVRGLRTEDFFGGRVVDSLRREGGKGAIREREEVEEVGSEGTEEVDEFD